MAELDPAAPFVRRAFLGALGAGVVAPLAYAANLAVRLSTSGPGSAGSVWHALITPARAAGFALEPTWVGGDPGQVQTQLLAGAVDVSAFGALGVAEIAGRGGDVVIFAPSLNNHGRWLVHGDSPYRSPRDLRGKRIATLSPASDTYRHAQMAAGLQGLDLKADFQVFHGPPTANVALFNRRDVEGVIAIEPTATRLVGAGAREIARVGDMWREATGDASPLFLVGYAARRAWLEANRKTAAAVYRLYQSVNAELRARPQLLAEHHAAMGIPASEAAAIALLPGRMAEIYSTQWDDAVFAGMERQIAVAQKLGILARRPERPVYDAGFARAA